MKKQKKAIASITSFILIIAINVFVLTFSYGYYVDSKTKIIELKNKQANINSILNFQNQIIELSKTKNTTLNFKSELDSPNIKIIILNNTLTGEYTSNEKKITNTQPSLVNFCNNFEFYPSLSSQFQNNGTCINKIN